MKMKNIQGNTKNIQELLKIWLQTNFKAFLNEGNIKIATDKIKNINGEVPFDIIFL